MSMIPEGKGCIPRGMGLIPKVMNCIPKGMGFAPVGKSFTQRGMNLEPGGMNFILLKSYKFVFILTFPGKRFRRLLKRLISSLYPILIPGSSRLTGGWFWKTPNQSLFLPVSLSLPLP